MKLGTSFKSIPKTKGWRCSQILSGTVILATLLVLPDVLTGRHVTAQSEPAEVLISKEECKVKYASLYAFGLLTTSPIRDGVPAEEFPFVIGVVGTKGFPELLQELAATRKIQDRPIRVLWIKKPEELDSCHIVYITANASSEVETDALNRLKSRRVLIVGERQESAQNYVVTFLIVDGRVRFALNHAAARARRITIDPRLVKSALP